MRTPSISFEHDVRKLSVLGLTVGLIPLLACIPARWERRDTGPTHRLARGLELSASLAAGNPSGRTGTVLWAGSENVLRIVLSNTRRKPVQIATGKTLWTESVELLIESAVPGGEQPIVLSTGPGGARLIPDINAKDLWVHLKNGQQIRHTFVLPDLVQAGLTPGHYSLKARMTLPAEAQGERGEVVVSESNGFRLIHAVSLEDQADALARQYDVALRSDDLASGLALAQQISSVSPDFSLLGSGFRFVILRRSVDARDVQEALSIYENILLPSDSNPDLPRPWETLMVPMLQRKIAKVQIPLPPNIDQRNVHLSNAAPLMGKNQNRAALQELLAASRQDPTFWITLMAAGIVHARLKDYDAAIATLRTAHGAFKRHPSYGQVNNVHDSVGPILERVIALKARE